MVVANIAIPDPARLIGDGSSKIGLNICGTSNIRYNKMGSKKKLGVLGFDINSIALALFAINPTNAVKKLVNTNQPIKF